MPKNVKSTTSIYYHECIVNSERLMRKRRPENKEEIF